jgi:adenosylcobinamide-GDP ribazoletransferase
MTLLVVRRQAGAFLAGIQFLTRIPFPPREPASPAALAASLVWFPTVGGMIGLLAIAVDVLARSWLAPPVAQAIVVAVYVVVSGALHLDGLIDAADGLATQGNGAARLAAMHQPAAGNMGSVAGLTALLLTFVAIGALPDRMRAQALFLAPLFGRTAIVLCYAGFPYARSDPGLSLTLKQGASREVLVTAVGSAMLLSGIAAGAGGLISLALVIAGVALAGYLATRLLGGLAGDLYGAASELTQVTVLLLAPMLL